MEYVNESQKSFRFQDYGPKYLFRGPHIEWGILVLKNNHNLGLHLHNEVEEFFYFLKGKGKILIEDKTIPIKAGDAFRIEPKEKHDLFCEEEIEAIFIKAPYLPEDKVSL
ncbi:MAG: cupin domain-containing protein [Candidatus Omnitrophica bacterium]|nr:cupin domain-containing protein [Candidatus Omnitrophota bacterium]